MKHRAPRPAKNRASRPALGERSIQRAMARAFHNARHRVDPEPSAAKDATLALNAAALAAPAALPSNPLDPLVARLSNWQRHQWARAGYPQSAQKLTEFALMERRDV